MLTMCRSFQNIYYKHGYIPTNIRKIIAYLALFCNDV
jgi:hypothetical protein